MYAPFCPRHGTRVLLDVSRITTVTALADGVLAVEMRCYDGELLVLLAGSRVSRAARNRNVLAVPEAHAASEGLPLASDEEQA